MRRFDLSAHLGYLFVERPLRERFAAARGAGFRYVEHPFPYAIGADEFRRLCAANGLTPVQIALPPGRPGEKGLAALAGREAEFRAGLAEAIGYATAIGCAMIHPMAGVAGVGADEAATWACYLANVAEACCAARRADLGIVIEPIGAGTLAGYFIDHPAKAMAAIDRVGADNLFLTLDAFHAARSGVDPAAFARQAGARLRHVQIADDPSRHEPGTGTIDFDALFLALDDIGYSGVIGLEYHPRSTTEAGLNWALRYPQIASMRAEAARRSSA